jgi:membrane AbrB-like protein
MTVLADAHGADMRLVAFMQYARVLIVALSASLLARFVAPDAFAGASPFDGPPTSFGGVAATLALLGAAAAFGRFTRLPAGVMLAPLAASGVAQASGLFAVELPTPLLALSYAALGWTVGLRFTRPLLRHALSALPAILASIVTLQLLCAGLSLLIARWAHVDPLTALLATSPGGLDAIAIIAVAAKLDLPFIMAAQTARFLLILAIGPRLAKALAHWAAPPNKSGRDAQNSSQDGLN